MTDCVLYVRRVDMPDSTRGFVAPDPDGNMNIYLNERLSGDAFDDAFAHELVHALRNDCFCVSPVNVLEEAV